MTTLLSRMHKSLLLAIWKTIFGFVVTASSSELSKIANTFIQLKLVIAKESKREDVFMGKLLEQVLWLISNVQNRIRLTKRSNTALDCTLCCIKTQCRYWKVKLLWKWVDVCINYFTELSLPQFYSLLHEMEKAKASLEQHSWTVNRLNTIHAINKMQAQLIMNPSWSSTLLDVLLRGYIFELMQYHILYGSIIYAYIHVVCMEQFPSSLNIHWLSEMRIFLMHTCSVHSQHVLEVYNYKHD